MKIVYRLLFFRFNPAFSRFRYKFYPFQSDFETWAAEQPVLLQRILNQYNNEYTSYLDYFWCFCTVELDSIRSVTEQVQRVFDNTD